MRYISALRILQHTQPLLRRFSSLPATMGSLPDRQQPFRVLVAGGSYGGLSVALNLQDICRGLPARCGPKPAEGEHVATPQFDVDITIVDERDGFCQFTPIPKTNTTLLTIPPDHLIGSPLALASESYAEKSWVKYGDIPALRSPNLRVLQGAVKSVDPARKVATYLAHGSMGEPSELQYDYFVAATGLRRVWPVVPQSLRRKQFLFEAGDHIRAATAARHGVVVVGGGMSPFCREREERPISNITLP
jgi:NADH dehydrogenase FAD-containing subunit